MFFLYLNFKKIPLHFSKQTDITHLFFFFEFDFLNISNISRSLSRRSYAESRHEDNHLPWRWREICRKSWGVSSFYILQAASDAVHYPFSRLKEGRKNISLLFFLVVILPAYLKKGEKCKWYSLCPRYAEFSREQNNMK